MQWKLLAHCVAARASQRGKNHWSTSWLMLAKGHAEVSNTWRTEMWTGPHNYPHPRCKGLQTRHIPSISPRARHTPLMKNKHKHSTTQYACWCGLASWLRSTKQWRSLA